MRDTEQRRPVTTILTRRRCLGGAMAVGMGALLAPCGGATAPGATSDGATSPTTAGGAPKRGGTLKAGLASDGGNLDPCLSSFLVDRQIIPTMYDSLVTIDADLTIVPAFAEKWELSGDGKTYTLTLRRGVKVHDGTDFKALGRDIR